MCSADDIIDNMMVSREWLLREFDIEMPTVAWQLDIFGHSAGHAQLVKEFGIESMVFARMPDDLFINWKSTESLEFMWKPQFLTGTN